MTDLPSSLFSMRVLVDNTLPIIPTPSEEARYIVQQGMREIMAWCGLPRMDEPKITHAVYMENPMTGEEAISISPKAYHVLRLYGLSPLQHPSEIAPVLHSVWEARNRGQLAKFGVVSF